MGSLFSFSGRGGRGRFWLGVLISIVLSIAAMLIVGLLAGEMMSFVKPDGTVIPATEIVNNPDAVPSMNPTWWLYYAVLAIPAMWVYLATGVQRAHDRGKSGWWLLLTIVPLVGAIWWLVDLGILEGNKGPNKFGPDPQAA